MVAGDHHHGAVGEARGVEAVEDPPELRVREAGRREVAVQEPPLEAGLVGRRAGDAGVGQKLPALVEGRARQPLRGDQRPGGVQVRLAVEVPVAARGDEGQVRLHQPHRVEHRPLREAGVGFEVPEQLVHGPCVVVEPVGQVPARGVAALLHRRAAFAGPLREGLRRLPGVLPPARGRGVGREVPGRPVLQMVVAVVEDLPVAAGLVAVGGEEARQRLRPRGIRVHAGVKVQEAVRGRRQLREQRRPRRSAHRHRGVGPREAHRPGRGRQAVEVGQPSGRLRRAVAELPQVVDQDQQHVRPLREPGTGAGRLGGGRARPRGRGEQRRGRGASGAAGG